MQAKSSSETILGKLDSGVNGQMVPSGGIFDPATLSADLVAGLAERGFKSILLITAHGNQRARSAALKATGVTVLNPSQITGGIPGDHATTAVVVEMMHATEVARAAPAIKSFRGAKIVCSPFGQQQHAEWKAGDADDRARILREQVFGFSPNARRLGTAPEVRQAQAR